MSKGIFKPKKPGDPVVMKLLKEEEQLLIDWINMQTTSSDSIRFLIQKEIAQNGLRDLQKYIPQIRDIASLRAIYGNGGEIGVTSSPVYHQTAATIPADVPAVETIPLNHTSDLAGLPHLTPTIEETSHPVDSKSHLDSHTFLPADVHNPASIQTVISGDQNSVKAVMDRNTNEEMHYEKGATQAILSGHDTISRELGKPEGKPKRAKRKTFDKATIDSYNV